MKQYPERNPASQPPLAKIWSKYNCNF